MKRSRADYEYEKKRNWLIPQAVRYAEEMSAKISEEKLRAQAYNNFYLRRMQELAYECGLCSFR